MGGEVEAARERAGVEPNDAQIMTARINRYIVTHGPVLNLFIIPMSMTIDLCDGKFNAS